MNQKRTTNSKNTNPAVCTAMDMLRILVEEKGETTTKGLAWRLGVPRTTCYRILQSLILKDWVRPLAGGYHELSFGLFPLLKPLWQVEQLVTKVQLALETLSMRTQFTAKVTVRQGDYAVTVVRCESPKETSVAVRLGAAFHLSYGSSGAVLLSDLTQHEIQQILDRAPSECWAYQKPEDVLHRVEELRTQGWCADLGQYHPSFHAISVPLRDAHEIIVAAMTIIGFPHEMPPGQIATPTKLLLDAARRAERELRKHPLERSSTAAAKTEKLERQKT